MKTLLISMLCSLAFSVCAQETSSLKLTKRVVLPGVKGRFDHFAIDTNGHRLFIAALGNNTLEIVDTAAGSRVKSITGLHKPTGVAYLAEQNQIVVANGEDGTLKVFNGTSFALLKSIGSLDDADNVRFDPKSKSIYVGYGDGALAIIDAVTMRQTGSVKLAGHPESFQLETKDNRIFVNVPETKQIAVVDREKQTVVATWPMKETHGNFPMALDEANKRLFVGCRSPAKLVVFDTTSQKPVASLAIPDDTDDLFYDAALKRIYVSCGEGFIDVIDQMAPDQYKVRERISTRGGARTSFFSSELKQLYVAVPQRGDQAAIWIYRTQ
jgi:DNA-binding beta-propeller fold protein YncE